MDKLTDNEKQLLAREVAADGYGKNRSYEVECPECYEKFIETVMIGHERETFQAGWDAAMEYVNAKKLEQSAESDRLRPEPTT